MSLVLGIESSCDETAAALVEDGRRVVASVVSSQIDLHARYGGVVPEIAGRAHLERIVPVLYECLSSAGLNFSDLIGSGDLRAVAATSGPGLVGSLLVGVSFAKSLAMSLRVPFIGINHLEGHLYASYLESELELPVVVLLVSGGHTLLISMDAPGSYELLGGTLDDAAGEAFDKVARYLGLSYPGGPAIEKASAGADRFATHFTRPMLNEGFDFSFSGLKTAVIHHVKSHPESDSNDIAACFQEAVVDVLAKKTVRAALASSARGVCLAGGVGANGPLRDRLAEACSSQDLALYLPSKAMCTDNAAMIAAAAHVRLDLNGPSPLSLGATPGLAFPARERSR